MSVGLYCIKKIKFLNEQKTSVKITAMDAVLGTS